MDKIAKIFFLLCLIIISCSKKKNYDKNINNIKFIVSKDITVDLKNEKLCVLHEGLKHEDTIMFRESEKKKIIDLFDKYNLGNKTGEFWYIDENSTTADEHDEIIILSNNKMKLHYTVNEYHEVQNNLLFESEEDKVVKFRNLMKSIIIKKSSYKRAYDSLRVFVKRKPVWLM